MIRRAWRWYWTRATLVANVVSTLAPFGMVVFIIWGSLIIRDLKAELAEARDQVEACRDE